MKTPNFLYAFYLVIVLLLSNQLPGQPYTGSKSVNPLSPTFLFNEDWYSGSFTTNNWSTSSANWCIDNHNGNDAPSAYFHRSPLLTNYSSSLTSAPIDAGNIHVGKIFLKIDIKLLDYYANGKEYLKIEIGDSTSWNTLDSIANNGSFDWESREYDITRFSMNTTFQIRFEAAGLNTINIQDWYLDNIKVYRICESPHDLYGDVIYFGIPQPGGATALLNWGSPQDVIGSGGWQHFDTGINGGGLYFVPDKIFVAAKWGPGMLSDYANDTIESAKIFIYDSGFEYVILKIWTGENGDNLIYSDTVDNIVPGTWTVCPINDTIIIDTSSYYWVGYELKKLSGNFMPPGIDNGPAVTGYGDNFKFDENDTWDQISNYTLDYNFNIEIYIDRIPLADPSTLLGFNVYRKIFLSDTCYHFYSFIQSSEGLENYQNHVGDSCNFTNLRDCSAFYKINAVWGKDGDTCVSDYANSLYLPYQDFVFIDFTESIHTEEGDETPSVTVSPNPSNGNIKIDADNKIMSVNIYDLQGEKLYQNTKINSNVIQLNVSNFNKGIYFLKVQTTTGIITKKFIVI